MALIYLIGVTWVGLGMREGVEAIDIYMVVVSEEEGR